MSFELIFKNFLTKKLKITPAIYRSKESVENKFLFATLLANTNGAIGILFSYTLDINSIL